MHHQAWRTPPTATALAALATLMAATLAQAAPTYPNQEVVCAFNSAREQQRLASAANFAQPVVQQMKVNGAVVWTAGSSAKPTLKPGDVVTLSGSGFGAGTDIDFSKIMIGNSRVLETSLQMYEQKLDILSTLNYETGVSRSNWPKDVLNWSDTEVQFTVPSHASKGPLRLQVQKRAGFNTSLTKPGQPHNVIDAQVYRIESPADVNCDVVSTVSAEAKAIAPIDVAVDNPSFADMVKRGREIFWSYDYNLGLSHKFKNLEWDAIMKGQATDPYTRQKANPTVLFGAVKNVAGQVPAESINDVYFKPYPQFNPTPGFLAIGQQLKEGNTKTTGYAGYRYAESQHPFLGKGSWIGFNCASCHGYQISYSKGASNITKVFPGLPNPNWTMKWATLGTGTGKTTSKFAYVNETEHGPKWAPGDAKVDKTPLMYLMPAGTGEATITRTAGEGGLYDNDYMFNPTAIPNVTFHLPVRRALSHTESYVGFEGSYIHAEEPDGAMGSMDAGSLKALTAYMSVLDQDDDDLRNVGLHRWLKSTGRLEAQTGSSVLSEGSFVQRGWQVYDGVKAAVARGKGTFDQSCASCHSDKMGLNSSEVMVPLNQVGRFFAPTDFQRKQQSIRATYLRNLYWVTSRGLLSDGHVRNLEDLVSPERCTEGSALYKQYYTLHAPVRPAPGTVDQPTPAPDLNRKGDVFRVYKDKKKDIFDTTYEARNRFVERHKYFSSVAGDNDFYYWDYQKMRTQYGPDEMGTPGPIGMPAAPHPWCAPNAASVSDLVQYLLTL
ncbi:hypothetical protein [Aquabacterium parvum]|uniref:hypothetical protein n=1 Tax=Aquabacterium parvum TaxID=70584 RepID=UPI0007190455|nr:hypothetical protein [Aquabacterium parvum]